MTPEERAGWNGYIDASRGIERSFWEPTPRKKLRLKQNAWWVVLLIVSLIVWFAIRSATAHDAKDPQWNDWLMAQKNQNNGQCCNETDTFVLGDNEWRVVDARYEVLHNGVWMPVPPFAITKSKENPTGGALLWIWDGRVQCFKPGTFY